MKKYWSVLTIVIVVLALSIGAFADEIKVGAGASPTNSILKPVKEHFEKASCLFWFAPLTAGLRNATGQYGSKVGSS